MAIRRECHLNSIEKMQHMMMQMDRDLCFGMILNEMIKGCAVILCIFKTGASVAGEGA